MAEPFDDSKSVKHSAHYNLPKTGNVFVNSQNYALHWRYVFPSEDVKPSLLLFWIHGYTGHVNGPVVKDFTERLSKRGCVVVLIDLQGHGYSEGERALMYSHTHMVSDTEDFIGHVRSWEKFNGSNCLTSNLSESQKEILKSIPYFVQGQVSVVTNAN